MSGHDPDDQSAPRRPLAASREGRPDHPGRRDFGNRLTTSS